MTFSSYSAINGGINSYNPTFTSARTAVGVQVIADGALDGLTASALKFKFKNTSSYTGSVYARIYTPPVGAGLGTLQATSDAVDITTISDGDELNFPLLANYTCQPDDMICIFFDGADGTATFGIGRNDNNTSNSPDFDNSQMPGTWEVSGDFYSTYLVVTGGDAPTGTGTRLPPPPLIARF